MNIKKHTFFLVTLISGFMIICESLFAQQITNSFQFIKKKQKSFSLNFELINNLIVIPASINKSDTLKFILDTGVKNTIISDLIHMPSIKFKNAKKILIRGLGKGEPLNAYLTSNNLIEMPGIYGNNHDIVILEDDIFHFTSSLGIRVNGIIGYNYFKNFLIEINYIQKKMFLHSLNKKLSKRFRKFTEMPINIVKGKPYIDAVISQKQINNPVKLLIDSGASSALSIFKTATHITLPKNTFRDLLGIGLNGEIHGDKGRLAMLKIGEFSFFELVTIFPDELSVNSDLLIKNRHGSIGGEILKRFSVAYHYDKSKIYLKPNSKYKRKFSYNMSGLEIKNAMAEIPVYIISRIRKNSIGEKVGFKKGDYVISINNLSTSTFTFNDINLFLQGKRGKRIKLTVFRNGDLFTKVFCLKDELKLSESEKKLKKEQLITRESDE